MEIRFVSTLTLEDEERLAPALMTAVAALLDAMPITYALRLQTTGASVLHHSNLSEPTPPSHGRPPAIGAHDYPSA